MNLENEVYVAIPINFSMIAKVILILTLWVVKFILLRGESRIENAKNRFFFWLKR